MVTWRPVRLAIWGSIQYTAVLDASPNRGTTRSTSHPAPSTNLTISARE